MHQQGIVQRIATRPYFEAPLVEVTDRAAAVGRIPSCWADGLENLDKTEILTESFIEIESLIDAWLGYRPALSVLTEKVTFSSTGLGVLSRNEIYAVIGLRTLTSVYRYQSGRGDPSQENLDPSNRLDSDGLPIPSETPFHKLLVDWVNCIGLEVEAGTRLRTVPAQYAASGVKPIGQVESAPYLLPPSFRWAGGREIGYDANVVAEVDYVTGFPEVPASLKRSLLEIFAMRCERGGPLASLRFLNEPARDVSSISISGISKSFSNRPLSGHYGSGIAGGTELDKILGTPENMTLRAASLVF
jgi:hypothetical protein